MAGILISLLLVFLVFFIMTRTVWVRIIKGKDFKVEIHLPILAIHIVKKNDNGDKRKNPKSKDKKISYIGYFRIITGVVARLKNARIVIKKITLPINDENFDKSSIIKPLRQHALICAFIAYLRTKTEKLTLEDNAISLSPDVTALQCYVTFKLRLYQLIHGLLSVRHSIYEEKNR